MPVPAKPCMIGEEALARTFRLRSEDFMRSARAAFDRFGTDAAGSILHSTCCALELSLKSVILKAGGSDERNRIEIRHDLVKALKVARGDGFFAPPELASIAARLWPYYQTHSLDGLAKQMNKGDLAKIIAAAARQVATTRADQIRSSSSIGSPPSAPE